jgi:hypothetical protein
MVNILNWLQFFQIMKPFGKRAPFLYVLSKCKELNLVRPY